MSKSTLLLGSLCAAALLGGCATVTSQHVGRGEAINTSALPSCATLPHGSSAACDDRPPSSGTTENQPTSSSAGIAYFLPRQLARVTATRTHKTLDEKIKALIEAQGELEAAAAAITRLESAVRTTEEAIIEASDNDAGQAILTARLTAQKAELATARTTLTTRQTAVQTATNDVQATSASTDLKGPGAYNVILRIELLPPSADPAHAYRLNPNHSIFRDDEHKFAISPTGLLTSTEVIAADRTADILVEMATFAGALQAPGAAALPPGRRTARDRCVDAPNDYTGVVDFADPASVGTLNGELACLGVRAQVDGQVWSASTRPRPTSARGVDGIVYRQPVEVLVRIQRCRQTDRACDPDSHNWFVTEVIALALPQAGPISYVRQTGGFMTRSRYGMTFSNGILTNYDASRPSELLEIARTPMRLVQGAADGLSRVVSIRTGENNNRAALVNSEVALQTANAALRASGFNGQTTVINAQLSALNARHQFLLAQIDNRTARGQAETNAINQEYARQVALITGQTGLNTALLGFNQSQGSLLVGTNNTAAQVSASNLDLAAALLRDQDRRDTLYRCIAQQAGLGQPISPCLTGF
jgi:hypothetical protein